MLHFLSVHLKKNLGSTVGFQTADFRIKPLVMTMHAFSIIIIYLLWLFLPYFTESAQLL